MLFYVATMALVHQRGSIFPFNFHVDLALAQVSLDMLPQLLLCLGKRSVDWRSRLLCSQGRKFPFELRDTRLRARATDLILSQFVLQLAIFFEYAGIGESICIHRWSRSNDLSETAPATLVM